LFIHSHEADETGKEQRDLDDGLGTGWDVVYSSKSTTVRCAEEGLLFAFWRRSKLLDEV